MTLKSPTMVFAMLLTAHPSFADQEQAALQHLEAYYYSQIANNVAQRLENSGLSETDIDKLAETVVNGVAKCTISAVVTHCENPDKFVDKLADGVNFDDIENPECPDLFSTLKECINQVSLQAGLSPNP